MNSTTNKKIKELRKSVRVGVNFSANCKIIYPNNCLGKINLSPLVEADAINISTGGMGLSWPRWWQCKGCPHCLHWKYCLACELLECPFDERNRVLSPNVNLEVEIPFSFLGENNSGIVKLVSQVVWVKAPLNPNEYKYNLGINFKMSDSRLVRLINNLYEKK